MTDDASTMMESFPTTDVAKTMTVTRIPAVNESDRPTPILKKAKTKKKSIWKRVFCCTIYKSKHKRELLWQMEQNEAMAKSERCPSVASSLNYFDADDYYYGSELSNNGSLQFFDAEEYEESHEQSKYFKIKSLSKSVRFVGVNRKATVSNTRSMLILDDNASVGSLDGFPGMLSAKQVNSVIKFQRELKKKEPTYQEMVQAYSEVESEAFALCRFCRARDFNVSEVIEMMSQHIDYWKEASKHNFYEDIDAAVGAPLSVLLTQYPFLFMGNSKQGFPVCYFKAAGISSEGMECITSAEGLVKIQWFIMMHQAKQCYREAQAKYPDFFRMEQITIINLKGISRSLFSSKNLNMLKLMNTVLEVFPEMLYRCVVINAPSFFAMAWTLVKKIVDKNTAKKVVVFSSEAKGQRYLLDLIDKSELASDYGGTFTSTEQAILKQGKNRTKVLRQFCQLFQYSNLSKNKPKEVSHQFELEKKEKLSITIYTKCRQTVSFKLINNSNNEIIKSIPIKESNPDQSKSEEDDGQQHLRRQSKRYSSNVNANDPYSKRIVSNFELTGSFTLTGILCPERKMNDQYILVVGDIFEA